jgi:hypothetical protein
MENKSSSAPSLGQHREVALLGVARLPRGAVDALELRVALAAPPVGGGRAQQRERRDGPGGRDVRSSAQVPPAPFAGARVEVVIDGQLAAAHLDAGLGVRLGRRAGVAAGGGLGRPGRLRARGFAVVARPLARQPDQLQLERLVGQLGARLGVGDHPPGEPLPAGDDRAHLTLEGLQILGGERHLDGEVVVEAVGDRRPDAEPGAGEQLLHRLRQHVRGGVPDDRPALVGVDGDRLDLVAVAQHPGQVAGLAVDPGGDDRAVTGEQVGRGGARRDRPLAGRGFTIEGDAHAGHRWAPVWVVEPRAGVGRPGNGTRVFPLTSAFRPRYRDRPPNWMLPAAARAARTLFRRAGRPKNAAGPPPGAFGRSPA